MIAKVKKSVSIDSLTWEWVETEARRLRVSNSWVMETAARELQSQPDSQRRKRYLRPASPPSQDQSA